MARVNVEQKALTDPRFSILGSHLSPLTRVSQAEVEAAFGMYTMIRVWNYCMERGLLEVPSRDLDALHPGLADAMIDAQLGEKVPRSRARLVRIKGGEGRIDWLEQARVIGRENGAKGAQYGSLGGRPRKDSKPPVGVSQNPVGGLSENPLPAPAPAPAPAQIQEENKSARAADRFAEFWAEYPRKEAKGAAERAWRKIDPPEDLFAAIMAAVQAQKVRGCLEPRSDHAGRSFIPHPATWLNAKRWEDTPPPAGEAAPRMDSRTAYAVDTLRDCFEEPNP